LIGGIGGALPAFGIGCAAAGELTPGAITLDGSARPDATYDTSAGPFTDTGTDTNHGRVDASLDTGSSPIDGGQDSTLVDAGADTGTADSGGSDGGTDDGAVDGSGPLDVAVDGSGPLDVATPDGGIVFSNPVQIDVSSVLTADTVATTTLADAAALTFMDLTGNDLVTQSKASQLYGTGVGLPDNALFAANAVHPQVRLSWTNASNGSNSRVVKDTTPFTFSVPPRAYGQLQIYALSTEGSTTANFTVTYSDNTTNGGTAVTIADWFNPPTAGQFSLVTGLDRIRNGTSVSNGGAAIFGVNLNPDMSKAVKQVTIARVDPGGFLVFYGAAGW
jgi:hypothetical protein